MMAACWLLLESLRRVLLAARILFLRNWLPEEERRSEAGLLPLKGERNGGLVEALAIQLELGWRFG